MREWKPGDVAVSFVRDVPHVIFRSEDSDGDVRWYDRFGPLLPDDEWAGGKEIRPLVVIDPEDREQVERLTQTYLRAYDGVDTTAQVGEVDSMQAALRSLIAPPKPEEPMGLGAVVEDAMGTKWVRHDSSAISCPWINTDDCQARYRKYDEINAVHKLSDGVQP